MKLEQLRKEHNLTRQELAFKTGLSISYIYFIEREEKQPSFDVADRIASVFNVPVEELFPQFNRRSPYPDNTVSSCK
jgi:putative transcriptional regulator